MSEECQDFENKVKMVEALIEKFPEPRRQKIKEMFDGAIGEHYFTAPASTKKEYHCCFAGGLLVHSLNVVNNLKIMADCLCKGKWSNSKLSFVGLFHDLGKAGDGEEPFYAKKNSDWHNKQGIMYEINKDCLDMPHSERSLYLLQRYGIPLDKDEYLAIRLHDGMNVESNIKYSMKEPDLALLLHWADRWSVVQEKNL